MGALAKTLPSGVGLIELSGPLLSEQELEGLRATARGFVDAGVQKLVIDLSGVTYLNSSAMAVLVSVHTTYSKRHWQLKLCGIKKNVHVVFAITNLDKVFTIEDTRVRAVEILKQQH